MFNNNKILIGMHYLSCHIFIWYLKTWFELLSLGLNSKFKYYLNKVSNLFLNYFTQVCKIII
jgi:hypothetical protein